MLQLYTRSSLGFRRSVALLLIALHGFTYVATAGMRSDARYDPLLKSGQASYERARGRAAVLVLPQGWTSYATVTMDWFKLHTISAHTKG